MKSYEGLIRLAILMLTLTAILWINASKFDSTEIKALSMFFLEAASIEGGTSYLKQVSGKSGKRNQEIK